MFLESVDVFITHVEKIAYFYDNFSLNSNEKKNLDCFLKLPLISARFWFEKLLTAHVMIKLMHSSESKILS